MRWQTRGVSGYGQYCPIVRATEIFAERWTPLILREMLFNVHRFSDLERGLPGIPRSLLSGRLARFEREGIVERRIRPGQRTAGYWLTAKGRSLDAVVEALGAWGATWAFDADIRPEELDPKLLLWWIRRRIDLAALPPGRVVVRFTFRGIRTPMWLVLERPEPSVCLIDPGYDVDLEIDADLAAFYRVWLGHTDLAVAVEAREIVLDGAPSLAQAFPSWLQLSHLAPIVRARGARQRVGLMSAR